jgi:hypothetical protein
MSEELAKSVKEQEVATPEANVQTNKPEEGSSSKEESKGSKDYNFAALRQQNDELKDKVTLLTDKLNQVIAPKPTQERDELEEMSRDDIPTLGQVERLVENRAEKKAKKIVEESFKEMARQQLPQLTKAKYNDFDQVITNENIKLFEQQEPELAAACAKSDNPWETSYRMIKKIILTDKPHKSNAAQTSQKIEENLSKPASVNSAAKKGPLANANAWGNLEKEEVYKEMMHAANQSF